MKNLYIILIFFGIIGLVSCQKNFGEDEEQATTSEQTLDESTFSSNFNWDTGRNINFVLTSDEAQTVYITSSDAKTRYYHCQHPGSGEQLDITINLPTSVEYVLINGEEVSIALEKISKSL
jgi:hypothetical protein